MAQGSETDLTGLNWSSVQGLRRLNKIKVLARMWSHLMLGGPPRSLLIHYLTVFSCLELRSLISCWLVAGESLQLSEVILESQPCGPLQPNSFLLEGQQESLPSQQKDLRSHNIITGMMQPSPMVFNATKPREWGFHPSHRSDHTGHRVLQGVYSRARESWEPHRILPTTSCISVESLF